MGDTWESSCLPDRPQVNDSRTLWYTVVATIQTSSSAAHCRELPAPGKRTGRQGPASSNKPRVADDRGRCGGRELHICIPFSFCIQALWGRSAGSGQQVGTSQGHSYLPESILLLDKVARFSWNWISLWTSLLSLPGSTRKSTDERHLGILSPAERLYIFPEQDHNCGLKGICCSAHTHPTHTHQGKKKKWPVEAPRGPLTTEAKDGYTLDNNSQNHNYDLLWDF